MGKIRVDPEELKQAAQELAAAADRLRELEGELSEVASNAQSYDGQFGPKVRALGAEGEAAIRAQSQRLSELSEQLGIKAEEFIQADQQSQSGLAALGELLYNLLQSVRLAVPGRLSPGPTGTPVPTAQPVAIPTPEMSATPVPRALSEYQHQLALNARYGFCVYPLTDPDAIHNYVAEGGMAFGKGPFQSLPGPAPGDAFDGLSTNRWLVAMKSFGLIAQAWRREANLAAMESMEPNLGLQLHYASYEDGMRVWGLEVHNQSDELVNIFRTDIYEVVIAPDGASFPWRKYQWLESNYVGPDDVSHIQFGSSFGPFLPSSDLHVQVLGTTLGPERQPRWEAWSINAETGEAVLVAPQFYETR